MDLGCPRHGTDLDGRTMPYTITKLKVDEWQIYQGWKEHGAGAEFSVMARHGCYTNKHGVWMADTEWHPLREEELWKCKHCGQVAPEGLRMLAQLLVVPL